MNNGMIKTTIREIKGSLGRYIAILAIVMLGVAFFTGLKATTPAMIVTENDYLLEQDFFDFKLLSTIGFDEESPEELKKLSEIADVEGAVSVDALCAVKGEEEKAYKFHTVPEKINRIVLTAGRMPENADECVLDAAYYGEDAVGMEITLTENNEEDTLDMFKSRKFTAVGVVRSPYYINFERGTTSIGEGTITAFIYVPREAFDCDYLTEIYATTKLKYKVYTDEYDDYIDKLQSKMEDKNSEIITARFDRIIAEAQEKIDDAQTELNDKKAEAETELADAWQEILDGEKELKDGEKELADARKKIADGKEEIATHEQDIIDGEIEIADGIREIQENEKKLKDAEEELKIADWKLFEGSQKLAGSKNELASGKARLGEEERNLNNLANLVELEKTLSANNANTGNVSAGNESGNYPSLADVRAQLEEAKKQIDPTNWQNINLSTYIEMGGATIKTETEKIKAGEQAIAKAEADLRDGEKEVAKGWKELNDGKAELADAKVELADGMTKLEEGRAELEQAKIDLADAEKDLAKGKKDLEEGEAKLADAKIEYADAEAEFKEEVAGAQKKVDDAQTELDDTEEPDQYVLTRETNVGYACYESDANIVEGIANVFPVFFFLVAALICMTTMNRMVEEQRTQIGVLKALGYSNLAIMSKYLFYAGSAASVGAVLGAFGGTWLFPKVIWMGYGIMYRMGDIQYFFDVKVAILSLAAALLCSVGAAYFSCRHELYSVPASLIRPKAPKNGKRIFLERIPFIWKRLKFLHKVSVRNIVRYKKRFFMMILGISGCTALLLTGFGIKDSVSNVAAIQYEEIQVYDIGITLVDKAQPSDRATITRKSAQQLSEIAWLYEEGVDLYFGDKVKAVYLEIPEDSEKIETFLKLHTPAGEKIPYPGEGEAVLTKKVADNLGIKAGDTVTLQDNDKNRFSVKVSALCENYVSNFIYVNRESYVNQMGKEPNYRSAYTAVKEGIEAHEAAAAISDMERVLAVSVTADMTERIGAMMDGMDYIVLLVIVCAGSLAFIVLYNLTNINITERIREIATIKVLGFYAKETADYVFRENLVLTAMGAAVGLLLGNWLHQFVMSQVNIDMVSFKVLIKPSGYLWSLVYTFAFALLVNGVMYFKLEKINMAESLKSIE